MRYICTVLSVSDIKKSRKFYENLFGLELYQDYGINISFTCGLALQQDFDWLVNIPKEAVLMKMVITRFLDSGLTMEEVSNKMDASAEDLQKLLDKEE